MSVIVIPNGSGFQDNPARVAYSNLLELGTVSASSESPAFPVQNAYDWVTTDFFQPASGGTTFITLTLVQGRAANYLAYYAQDLWSKGGSLSLQYWDGSAWVDTGAGIAPSDNSPRVLFFPTVTATQWRVAFTCATPFNIGALAFGEYLALPQGMYLNWTPPVLGRSTTTINSVSENGAFLGRSVLARGMSTTLQLTGASDEWVRQNWLPFIRHAELKPFWFVPNAIKYPTDCTYCWAEGEVGQPVHSNYGYMSHTIQLRGLTE